MQPTDLEPVLLESLGEDWQIDLKTPDFPKHDWGACLLWNKKVLEKISLEHVALPKLDRNRWWERWWIRRGGYGPEAFTPQREALIGTFKWQNHSLRVTNVHLDWEGGLQQRRRQIAFIKNYLKTLNDVEHEILCGDFNTITLRNKYQTKEIEKALGDDFKNVWDVPEITLPPVFSPDKMFVKNLSIVNRKIEKVSGSDHFPLFVELVPDK